MIKTYKQFITEKLFTTNATDPVTVKTFTNQANELDDDIDQFEKKKVAISTIYANYTDERDLINKLVNAKLINSADNKNTINFDNPLLNIWAQSCEKRREVTKINEEIEKLKKNMQSDQENNKAGNLSDNVFQENQKANQTKLDNFAKEIQKLQDEIVALETKSKEDLKQTKDDLNFIDKRVRNYQMNKAKEINQAKPTGT